MFWGASRRVDRSHHTPSGGARGAVGRRGKAGPARVPADVLETLSAFSNTADGGVILLGLDENSGFEISGVEDVERVTSRVAQACRDELEPPLQPLITADDIDGRSVVVVEVAELPASQKPCFIKSRGSTAAVANAVADALGRDADVVSLPLTPQRVREMIRK